MSILIQGAKKGQQAQHTPSIIDDTVASISKIKILYALSEGEIKGLANGAASIMLDSTPLLDASGTANFEGVEWEMRHGTVDQTHIAGMPSASSEIGVNTILRSGIAWVRTINNTQLSSINVNVSWSRLSETNDKFDVIGTKVAYVIDVQTDGHGYVTLLDTSITAKTSGRYQRTHNIKLPEATSNWQIRVRKITPDGDGERVFNQMQIDSIAEIIDAKLRYPCTALLYLSFDARTFSNIPKLSVDLQGVYVQIPSNYDPVTRTSTGLWNGTFKQGFTTNPAWHYYNLITNDRYGLGANLQPFMIDKWSLEYIARICDQPVDDGKGGTEPRFECNLYLQKAEQAYQVLQHIAGIFRGLSFWNGSQIIIDADTPRDAAYVITRANVVDGQFIKTGTAASQRHTIAQVAYSNPNNAYETEYAMVRNESAIAQRGINILDMSAVGCTSEGQAYRMGLAALLTEQNRTQTVSFAMGLDGSIPTVGDRVDIADMMFTGANNGGRISAVNSTRTVITVDRDNIPAVAGDKLIVNLESGKAQSREILSIAGRDVTVKAAFDPVAADHVWAINTEEMSTMPFIVMSVTANDDNTQYNYTALQYDPHLYAQIDNGTLIEPKPPSPSFNPYVISAPGTVTVSSRHRVNQGITLTTLVITWDQVKDAVAYDVEWRKDDGDWIKMPRTGNISAEIDGVYSGNYLARVRAVSAFEAVSKPTSSMLTAVTGKNGTPPALLSFKATGLLFGMQLNWTFATGSGDTAYTEIQVAAAPDVNIAALGQHAYPTDSAVINGLQGNLTQYYRARIVDKLGFKSVWTDWISGTTDANADKVMDLIQGQINESSLNASLTTKIDKIAINESAISAETQARIDAILATNTAISKETQDRIDAMTAATAQIDATKLAVSKETQARIDAVLATNTAISAEQQARITAIAAANDKIADEAVARANDILATNNKIIAESNVRATDILAANTKINLERDARVADVLATNTAISTEIQARTTADSALSNRIDTVTASTGDNKAAIASEVLARTNADSALSTRIDTTVAQTGANTSAITSEVTARTTADTALSGRIDIVSSKTDTNAASITSVSNTLTDKIGAQAERIDVIKADYSPEYVDSTQYANAAKSTQWTYAKTVARDNYATNERITALQSSVADSDARVTKTLNTLVTKDEALASDVTALQTKTSDNAAAIVAERETRTTAISALATDITSLQAKTGENTAAIVTESQARTDADTALSGQLAVLTTTTGDNKSAIVSESQARTTADTALGLRIDAVTAQSGDNKAAITAEITARTNADTALSQRVDTVTAKSNDNAAAIVAEQTARTSADTALANNITGLQTKTGENTAAIIAEQKARTDADTAIADSVTTLNAKVGTNTAAITAEQTARSDADAALTLSITALQTKTGENTAAIVTESQARTTADTALASDISALQTSTGDNAAAIVTEQKTRSDADTALSSRITTVTAESGANKTAIQTEQTTRANADTALSGRIDTVTAESGANKTAIQTEVTARTNADSALGQRIDTVSSKTDANAASITTVSNTLTNELGSQAEQINVIRADYKPQYADSTHFASAARSTQWTYAKTVARDNYATNERITNLQSSVADSNAQITKSLNTLATKDEALASSIDALTVVTGQNSASITSEATARTTADNALSSRIDVAVAKTGDNAAAIASEVVARTDADSALSTSINALQVKSGENTAAIVAEKTARTSADDAMVLDINALQVKAANNTAAIVTEQNVRANADSALSQRIDIVQSSTATAQSAAEQAALDAQTKSAQAKADAIAAANLYATAEAKAKADAAQALAEADATSKANAAKSAAEAAAALDAKNKADAALDAAKTDATSKADAAQAAATAVANAAQTAANNAATAAGNKGEVIFGSTAPIGSKQLPQNLWIDTTGGKNTPKRWDGLAWVVVTDKAAVDAQAAANAAQSTATEALGKADTATTNIATIKTELTATTSKTNATATSVGTLQTTVGANTASIQTAQSSIDGMKLEYTVKLDSGGKISGFGMMNDGATSAFDIRADRFSISAPVGKPNDIAGTSPLMVLTNPQVIDGVTVPAGVYARNFYAPRASIDTIQIKDAAIKTAQIDNLAVTTGKIANLAVDTLQINNYAVTIPVAVNYPAEYQVPLVTSPTDYKEVMSIPIPSSLGDTSVQFSLCFQIKESTNIRDISLRITVDGDVVADNLLMIRNTGAISLYSDSFSVSRLISKRATDSVVKFFILHNNTSIPIFVSNRYAQGLTVRR